MKTILILNLSHEYGHELSCQVNLNCGVKSVPKQGIYDSVPYKISLSHEPKQCLVQMVWFPLKLGYSAHVA